MRRVIETCLGLLLGALLLTGWLVAPFEIVGSSMVPALLGAHRDVECHDCGHPFAIDGQSRPFPGQPSLCPNCGSLAQRIEDYPAASGERVLVDRTAFLWREPRRWELVSLRDPRDGTSVVKRVVGLPGETVELRGGDVYINGHIARKNLAHQWAQAVLVHDEQHAPAAESPFFARWQPQQTDDWQRQPDGRWLYTPADHADSDESPTGWLVYRHLRPAPGAAHDAMETPIDDNQFFNQPRAVFQSRAVRDVLLECQVRCRGSGRWALSITDGSQEFIAWLDLAAARATLEAADAVLAEGELSAPSPDGAWPAYGGTAHVQWSLVDRRVLLAIDGNVVLEYDVPESHDRPSPSSRPVALAAQDLAVEVEQLRVGRDVYYAAADELSGDAERPKVYRLGPDELFVLGDNSPVSLDSRHWQQDGDVTVKSLLGKPLLVYMGHRATAWGTGRIQVPDFTAIRYIP